MLDTERQHERRERRANWPLAVAAGLVLTAASVGGVGLACATQGTGSAAPAPVVEQALALR